MCHHCNPDFVYATTTVQLAVLDQDAAVAKGQHVNIPVCYDYCGCNVVAHSIFTLSLYHCLILLYFSATTSRLPTNSSSASICCRPNCCCSKRAKGLVGRRWQVTLPNQPVKTEQHLQIYLIIVVVEIMWSCTCSLLHVVPVSCYVISF